MTAREILTKRNQKFANTFTSADLPILPKLNTLLLTCADARVDPAHILGLDLGDAVVIRNNGGRVTRAVIEEIATLAVMVAKMTQGGDPSFDVILMQHTQCGAERLADAELQKTLKDKLDIDVSEYAIIDQKEDLVRDMHRLRDAPQVPHYLSISAQLYDVKTGKVTEIVAPTTLAELRNANADAPATES